MNNPRDNALMAVRIERELHPDRAEQFWLCDSCKHRIMKPTGPSFCYMFENAPKQQGDDCWKWEQRTRDPVEKMTKLSSQFGGKHRMRK